MVYKATIDDCIVAVKVPVQLDFDRCLTEASMAAVMNHNTMGKLYGCCLETFIPLQVYEFTLYGSLDHSLHGDVNLLSVLNGCIV